jgi:hypothetical protein
MHRAWRRNVAVYPCASISGAVVFRLLRESGGCCVVAAAGGFASAVIDYGGIYQEAEEGDAGRSY